MLPLCRNGLPRLLCCDSLPLTSCCLPPLQKPGRAHMQSDKLAATGHLSRFLGPSPNPLRKQPALLQLPAAIVTAVAGASCTLPCASAGSHSVSPISLLHHQLPRHLHAPPTLPSQRSTLNPLNPKPLPKLRVTAQSGSDMADTSAAPAVSAQDVKLGFVGAGQMAEALARGWSSRGVIDAANMTAMDVSTERLKVFEGIGVAAAKDVKELAARSDIIFIAVKPFNVKTVLSQLQNDSLLSPRHLVVSIAAGVTIQQLQLWAGEGVRIVRVMPNTPCLVGQTAAAMSLGPHATGQDAALVRKMFEAVGSIHIVDEKLLDAVTGLSGSGPAYVFVAIEALADGGVAAGLPRDVALSLAAQTVLGSAKMVLETGKHPGQLKDSVASPGGTTIAGLCELEKGGFRSLLIKAVVAATERSREMSK